MGGQPRHFTVMNTPWISDLLSLRPGAVALTREAFVARYFPRYVEPWRPDCRIRLRPDGRPTRTLPGNTKAQNTKRTNRVDVAFASYLETFAEAERMNAPRE